MNPAPQDMTWPVDRMEGMLNCSVNVRIKLLYTGRMHLYKIPTVDGTPP